MADFLSCSNNRSVLAASFFISLCLATAFWCFSSPGYDPVFLNVDAKSGEELKLISSSSNLTLGELYDLAEVLHHASFNKTVILTPLNRAWAAENSMLDHLLESFQSGENTSQFLNHLVVVALDQVAYDRCSAVHPGHCFKLRTPGVDFSAEKVFMSEDYLKMTRRKISFLTVVLRLGYSFIFTDGDVLWFRNPIPLFSQEADFEVSCDHFNGNETDMRNAPNTGFIHVKANNRTVELYEYWHKFTEIYAGDHDQNVFNRIKRNPEFQAIGARIRFLPTKYFSCFCERPSALDTFCTMHANCCVGLQAKLGDLRLVLDDWKRYANQTSDERKTQQVSFRAPDACLRSWH